MLDNVGSTLILKTIISDSYSDALPEIVENSQKKETESIKGCVVSAFFTLATAVLGYAKLVYLEVKIDRRIFK
jgi:hypothetical protein